MQIKVHDPLDIDFMYNDVSESMIILGFSDNAGNNFTIEFDSEEFKDKVKDVIKSEDLVDGLIRAKYIIRESKSKREAVKTIDDIVLSMRIKKDAD